MPGRFGSKQRGSSRNTGESGFLPAAAKATSSARWETMRRWGQVQDSSTYSSPSQHRPRGLWGHVLWPFPKQGRSPHPVLLEHLCEAQPGRPGVPSNVPPQAAPACPAAGRWQRLPVSLRGPDAQELVPLPHTAPPDPLRSLCFSISPLFYPALCGEALEFNK